MQLQHYSGSAKHEQIAVACHSPTLFLRIRKQLLKGEDTSQFMWFKQDVDSLEQVYIYAMIWPVLNDSLSAHRFGRVERAASFVAMSQLCTVRILVKQNHSMIINKGREDCCINMGADSRRQRGSEG